MKINLTTEQTAIIQDALYLAKWKLKDETPITKIHAENIQYELDLIEETLNVLKNSKAST